MSRPALASLLPILLASACADLGDRARTGACPAGATCSPATPVGLAFSGPGLGDQLLDDGLHPTAVGGHQPITILDAADGRPLDLPYLARIYDDAFTVTQAGSVATVGAVAVGSARLNIYEPGGALYDRITVDAQEVQRLELTTSDETLDPSRGVALAAGATQTFVIALRGPGATRLVDAGLIIASPGAAASVAAGWDAQAITAGAAGAIELAATTSAGAQLAATIAVAGAVDDIVPQPRGPLPLDQFDVVCASALAGADQIVGLPWRWTTNDPATLTSAWTNNCVGVKATRLGPLTLTATAGDRTGDVIVTVAAGVVGAASAPAPWTTGAGDRARGIVED